MVVSQRPSAMAPAVRPMLGPNSIFEERALAWTEEERAERQSLAEMVLDLGSTRRAIFTASNVDPDALACLRAATDSVLMSDAFIDALTRQGRPVEPVLSSDAQQVFEAVRAAFAEHSGLIARMFDEFGG